MDKFAALFEDEDGLFSGTPQQRYWEIFNQLNDDLAQDEFDKMMTKMAVMERMLMETIHEEELNRVVDQHAIEHSMDVEEHKKSLYMEYAGYLIYRVSD